MSNMFLNLIDIIVDKMISLLVKYRNKRKMKELRKRDPFIYH